MKHPVLLVLLPLFLLALMALFPSFSPSASPEASTAALSPTPTAGTPEPTGARFYRPYPALTGQPGFRHYYQIRCYPGCHFGSTPAAAETASVAQATVKPMPVRTRFSLRVRRQYTLNWFLRGQARQ